MTEVTAIQKEIKKYNRKADLRLVERAYAYAQQAHAGQVRLSGDPFLSHCTKVAEILTDLRLDTTTIAAGLLHDVLEDTKHTKAELEAEFGEEVARLVEGVTQMGRLKFKDSEEHQAENIRKMLIATAKDIRVILIKLADRLHNMQTLKYLPENKIQSISAETLQIYAPLAHRLGIAKIRSELEDLSLRYLNPDIYYELSGKVAEKKAQREKEIQDLCTLLHAELRKAGIKAEVTGRPKHFYSIYRKMVDQRKDFDEIFDLRALRIITRNLRDCYGALGIVHTLWTPVPGRFKDYIAMPKRNMYQSLHTAVLGKAGERVEIQIRTEEMHRTADNGIAAHWLYKETGDESVERFDERLLWLRQLLEWLQDLKDPKEFMESLRLDLFSGEVYVFTPKGRVIELPAGSTAVDFAYAIHTDIGNQCRAAKANGRMVSLKYRLKQGDVVEIITSKKQTPRRDWLDFVQTSRARSKIRHSLKVHEEAEDGKQAEEKEGRPRIQKPPETQRATPPRQAPSVGVAGLSNIMVRFAKCCNPLPGDKVIGYITRSRGLSIHREGCPNIVIDDPARLLSVNWDGKKQTTYPASIRVKATDRPNLLADVLASIRELNVNIASANAYGRNDGTAICDFIIEVTDQSHLNTIIYAIRQVEGVYSVRRSSLKDSA
ncbi:MAG: bifunctional (p)ppGpp synthetase/guanosine-3',5'-bis(diphosphate) 3'-pyrophosphohydrolase [Candidatus Abyssobacteria bacterium SURF_17]|uniref:Bifunctional (P)ppGpp synthetase/guanosine-3',5'-bis(Diphosphate) 3'-pyrophosphohydrolase n=1 Tax=Candidatus Abyssobacteria bacterium SURF_17 TaxID=2093361 RepID=A0A419F009_9BACT|nr:MAG: bifunctional (p)ppGpp synthetase/guanosine-3',5'-bis(diphosphate) 3'-pyrophosphohydrolase [Candidatus Abyssubacteria bacterium SURF_17]